jgi:hypothetical protein
MAQWYDLVGAIGGGIGGIGSMLGAAAAWRAAASSRETSRDALEALALGLRPVVDANAIAVPEQMGDARSPWRLRVWNAGEHAARDVSVAAEFLDGLRVKESWERLGPGDEVELMLREVATPPGGPTEAEAGEQIVVRFSDDRDIARYEQRFDFVFRQPAGQPKTYTGSIVALQDAVRIR